MYYSPAGSRLKVKSSERKTSPFNTFWYIRLGDGGITSKVRVFIGVLYVHTKGTSLPLR